MMTVTRSIALVARSPFLVSVFFVVALFGIGICFPQRSGDGRQLVQPPLVQRTKYGCLPEKWYCGFVYPPRSGPPSVPSDDGPSTGPHEAAAGTLDPRAAADPPSKGRHNFILRGDTWDYRACIPQENNTCSTYYAAPNWGVSTGKSVCGTGTRQSPINVPARLPKETSFPKLKFDNWHITPKNASLRNTGHNVEYDFNIDDPDLKGHPSTSGGGLDGSYILAQGHFHWGCVDTVGSEHKINNVQYPMELHLVHYKSTLKTAKLAQNSGTRDGLAVLSILFEVQAQDNPYLTPIMTALHNEKKADPVPVRVPHEEPLVKLLPNTDRFYRYYGSLTTPPCNEAVVWTIFKEPVGISVGQLQAFRQVERNWEPCGKKHPCFPKLNDKCQQTCEEGIPLVNNFRPTQDLNGRDVFEVETVETPTARFLERNSHPEGRK